MNVGTARLGTGRRLDPYRHGALSTASAICLDCPRRDSPK